MAAFFGRRPPALLFRRVPRRRGLLAGGASAHFGCASRGFLPFPLPSPFPAGERGSGPPAASLRRDGGCFARLHRAGLLTKKRGKSRAKAISSRSCSPTVAPYPRFLSTNATKHLYFVAFAHGANFSPYSLRRTIRPYPRQAATATKSPFCFVPRAECCASLPDLRTSAPPSTTNIAQPSTKIKPFSGVFCIFAPRVGQQGHKSSSWWHIHA